MTFDPAQPLTMSSREIADLTGKEHRNVLRDVRALLDELNLDALSFEHIYKDASNRQQTEYRLPKRETLILVSGYSVQMRARIVDRWQELEAQATKPAFRIPQTLGEALRLAAELEEKRAALALENEEKARLLEEQKPHVEYAEALLASDETIDMAQMAQELTQAGFDIGRNNLFRLLRKEGILKSDNRPYREYADWFHVEARIFTDRSGQPHSTYTTLVTPRGEAALLRKYAPKRTAIVAKPPTKMRGLFNQHPASAKLH
ncbi:Rha family transcriptional regulator [Burkholderia multivorans]|uniref:Rha family transcriptional regulator n=1 Tax=Burkholderia multivorans TaxID=87883 RepID=UPI002ED27F46|nr:phage regulatory protein/antirepressor Ant [Burkholderia multivorans]